LNASLLLAYICTALLLQLAGGVGVAVWRHRGKRRQVSLIAVPGASPATIGAWAGWRAFRVARRQLEDPAQSQCSFYLEPVDGVPLQAFKPGQYLTFSLQMAEPNAAAGGEAAAVTRCYSLSDQPASEHYRITVKRAAAPAGQPALPPGGSSTWFHNHIHEGDLLSVRAPAGHFFIDSDGATPAVLIGGGIGITPMISMLGWCLNQQPARTVHLYYGVRSSQDHAFKGQLEALAASHPQFHLNVVYSQPRADDVQGRDYQHTGYVDLDLLRRTLPHGRHQFYVCGPAPMMESLVPAIAGWGVPTKDIHFEAFGPASVRLPDGDTTSRKTPTAVQLDIQFLRSGRTLAWTGQDSNLLDFAERHRISVESGCRSGSCGSCDTGLVAGTVSYEHPPDYDVAPGRCLLCVARPESALVLEA
jgi:uncharacterized protein